MSKPTRTTIASSGQAWDAAVDDNFALIFESPIPIKEYANSGSLPPAGNFDRCFAVVNDGVAGWVLMLSDGSAWKIIGRQAAANANLTDSSGGSSGGNTIAAIPNPADSPASADALRDDLVTNTIPALKNAIATLAAKLNALQTNMRNAGSLA